jgi:predicted acyltransferase
MTQRQSARLDELDILRGLTVAAMIVVVSPGSWSFTYAPLQHADWHGWRFADLIFPDFLFGVGMALGLSFGRSINPFGDRAAFARKLFRRVAGLIALGLALNYLLVLTSAWGAPPVGPEDQATWRLPGVLQRIAVVYLFAVMILWMCSKGGSESPPRPRVGAIVGVIAAMLLGYWALLTFVPAPGHIPGDLSKAGNLPALIDRALFTPQHMWPLGAESWRGPVVYDPEGLLSSIPATANLLFGVLAAWLWTSRTARRAVTLLAIGAALIAAALLIDPLFPINKKIWTSSFALLSSGISFLLLAAVAMLVRTRARGMLAPFTVLGSNALLAFTLSIVLPALSSVPLPVASQPRALQEMGFTMVSAIVPSPHLASLLCALGVLAIIWLALHPLHRRGILVRL